MFSKLSDDSPSKIRDTFVNYKLPITDYGSELTNYDTDVIKSSSSLLTGARDKSLTG